MKIPSSYSQPPRLPDPRGPISELVIRVVSGDDAANEPARWLDEVGTQEAIAGDDFHLALYVLYELHYRSFGGVADDAEWDPAVLAIRATLEHHFERALRACVPEPSSDVDAVSALAAAVENATGPSLSQYMCTHGTLTEMREFAIHRSAYQLKEADPHTWALPRLHGKAKAALVEIQFDEYGLGEQRRMHSELFAVTMRELGLDPTYGEYLSFLPGPTLATVNLVSLFGLHRRLRAALIGHLAVFEMTSVVPMQRYSDALARLGMSEAARRFYDVHVEADASHQDIALYRMVAGLVDDDPRLAHDVVFGAHAVLHVEERFATNLLNSWHTSTSSLADASTVSVG